MLSEAANQKLDTTKGGHHSLGWNPSQNEAYLYNMKYFVYLLNLSSKGKQKGHISKVPIQRRLVRVPRVAQLLLPSCHLEFPIQHRNDISPSSNNSYCEGHHGGKNVNLDCLLITACPQSSHHTIRETRITGAQSRTVGRYKIV